MARKRSIKPSFWEDTKMAKLSAFARLLYIAMWNFADDEGYIENDLKLLKHRCLPYDDVNIEVLLKELIDLERVSIVNPEVLRINNFLDHQIIDHPQPSELKKKLKTTFTPVQVENNTETPGVCIVDFESVWKSYPNKDGRKQAERHFRTTVKTSQDFENIIKALNNYLSSDVVKRGFIKSGSTWFNGWQDWINPTPEMMKSGNGNKPQNGVKGDRDKYAQLK